MNRILVNARFLVSPLTGVQRYAREMVNALHAVGKGRCDLVLAVPQGVSFDLCDDIQLFRDPSPLPGHLWEQMRLPAIMRKTNADLLWSPCGSGPLLVRKQVVTVHDASVFACRECFKWTYRTFHRTLLPLLAGRVRRLITVSEFSKAELLSYKIGACEKISVIYNGINAQAFSDHNRKIPIDGERYVLSVGSRDPRKNVPRLLKAWEAIPANLKRGLKLVIAGGSGSGFAREVLGDVPRDVVFLGYVAEQDLASLYARAAIFVYPSIYEGFGFPPLEAMACKTPVIVSNAASLPEICGDAALYCDPFNVESIAEKIIELLDDPSMQEQLSGKGLERVKEFTWRKAATKLIQVFDGELN
ncbi:MAG: glycosyltransferase family 1 protein [Planctomycetota bacterium]|nr:glycosyltransferase family 1 protein [Planctomycetota bacterium]